MEVQQPETRKQVEPAGVVIDNRVGCRDACGNKIESPELNGWTFLAISKGWRCPNCVRALAEINFGAEY